MLVDGADELALEAERHVPDKAHQHLARVVVAQQQTPEGLDEIGAEFGLLELPDDRVGAVGDEHVAERLRIGEQPTLQERHLVVEGLDGLGFLQRLELRLRTFERLARVQVAEQVV